MRNGTYRSFAWLVRQEGLAKAKAYASKCVRLSGPWSDWDSMWDHKTYLVLEKGFQDTFAKAWSTYMSEKTNNADERPSVKEPTHPEKRPPQEDKVAEDVVNGKVEGEDNTIVPTTTKRKKGEQKNKRRRMGAIFPQLFRLERPTCRAKPLSSRTSTTKSPPRVRI